MFGTKPDDVGLVSVKLQSMGTTPDFNVRDAVDHSTLPHVDLADLHKCLLSCESSANPWNDIVSYLTVKGNLRDFGLGGYVIVVSVILSFYKQDNSRMRKRTSTTLGRHVQGMTILHFVQKKTPTFVLLY